MSKSKGNVIDPWIVLDTRGADALRWNFFSSGSPWTPRRVVGRGHRRVDARSSSRSGTRTRSSSPTRTSTAGAPRDRRAPAPTPTHVLDRWIRSRLHGTVAGRHRRARRVRRAARRAGARHASSTTSRTGTCAARGPRFWNSGRHGARTPTLHECLVDAGAAAGAVHARSWPTSCTATSPRRQRERSRCTSPTGPSPTLRRIDATLEAEMEQRAHGRVARASSARTEAQAQGAPTAPPGARARCPATRRFSDDVSREVADALNVKALGVRSPTSKACSTTRCVPNFRTLGPKAGKRMPLVKEALAAVDGADVRRALDDDGVLRPRARRRHDGASSSPTTSRCAPTSHEELALAQDDGYAVALDTTLDDELRAEGIARELIRVLNDHRKARRLRDRRPHPRSGSCATGRSRSGRASPPRLDRGRGARGRVRGRCVRDRPDGAVAVEVDGERCRRRARPRVAEPAARPRRSATAAEAAAVRRRARLEVRRRLFVDAGRAAASSRTASRSDAKNASSSSGVAVDGVRLHRNLRRERLVLRGGAAPTERASSNAGSEGDQSSSAAEPRRSRRGCGGAEPRRGAGGGHSAAAAGRAARRSATRPWTLRRERRRRTALGASMVIARGTGV